jgi:hypothetical protein
MGTAHRHPWIAALIVISASAAVAQPTGLGHLEFPTSGNKPAQERFLAGILLLHSFEYDDAREHFEAARKLEPGFAMAHWGEAMTYNEPLWFFQDTGGGRAALERLAPTREERQAKAPTAREKDYLAAIEILFFGPTEPKARDLSYAEAMRRLHEKYPDDLEAAAFYSLALLGSSHGGRDFRIYMRAAAVAEEIFTENSHHPGALHYLIHAYDDPVHAPLGLRSARIYANVAPQAAHALHMPSHIFIAMGLWDEYVKSNEDSWGASEARVRRKGLGVEHRGYHALWWLEYGYLQQGRLKDARHLLDIIAADASGSDAPIVHSHLAQMRAHYAIETGEPAPVHAPSAGHLDPVAAAAHNFADAYLAIRNRDRATAERLAAKLEQPAAAGVAAHDETHHAPDLKAIAIMKKQMEGLLLLDAQSSSAVETLKQTTEMEDAMNFEFGPPAPPKPAHELFGEVLLSLGYPVQAQAQFELALKRAPKRALSLLGLARAAAKAGNAEVSKEAFAELRRIRHRAD